MFQFMQKGLNKVFNMKSFSFFKNIIASIFYVFFILLTPVVTFANPSIIPGSVPNLAAWWDASYQPSVIYSGGKVSQWNDISGNGENFVQASSSHQPAYGSTTLNGLNVITFTSSNDTYLLTSDTNFSRLFYNNNGMSMFVVQVPVNTSGSTFDLYSGGSTPFFNWQNDATYYDWNYPTGDTGGRIITGGYATGVPHVYSIQAQPNATKSEYVDGALIASVATGTPSIFSCPLSLGDAAGCSQNHGSGPTDNTTEEIILYNSQLSNSNRQLIEGYLACKWGFQSSLASGHPYKTTCPSGAISTYPSSIPSLAAWYDMTNPANINVNGTTTVSSVSDLSGNGETLSQSTTANQPTFSSGLQNGLGGLTFNGSSTYLQSNDTNFSRLLLPTSSVFFVMNAPNGSNTSSGFISSRNPGASLYYDIFQQPGGYFDFPYPTNRFTFSAVSTGPHIWSAVYNEGSGSAFLNIDGTSAASGVSSATISTLSCPLVVGALGGCTFTGDYLNGSFNEILVYNTKLTTAQYQYVEGYLACKYNLQSNLPSGHPYKSVCPSGNFVLNYAQFLGSW